MAEFSRKSKVGFIGAGMVGGSLAVGLSEAGYAVVAVASRTPASANGLAGRVAGCVAYEDPQDVVDESDVVFVTTTDDAIEPVTAARRWRIGQGVVHCAGAASLDILEPAVRQGAMAGAMHPLQAFSSVENGVKSIPGTTFGIEAEGEMREYLREMATAIGGNPVFIAAEDKALYHLTGVMLGGLLTTLGATAAQLWDRLGIGRAEGVRALVPMMRSVSYNLETSGLPSAVAGPYMRGDMGTITKHLETLQARAPEVLPLYCQLALAGLPFCVEKGLAHEKADEIRELVETFVASAR